MSSRKSRKSTARCWADNLEIRIAKGLNDLHYFSIGFELTWPLEPQFQPFSEYMNVKVTCPIRIEQISPKQLGGEMRIDSFLLDGFSLETLQGEID